jgi:hypothetical protein
MTHVVVTLTLALTRLIRCFAHNNTTPAVTSLQAKQENDEHERMNERVFFSVLLVSHSTYSTCSDIDIGSVTALTNTPHSLALHHERSRPPLSAELPAGPVRSLFTPWPRKVSGSGSFSFSSRTGPCARGHHRHK